MPGQGLYLDELFFDKYNLKLDYEVKKRERGKANREAKAKAKQEALQTNTELMETVDVGIPNDAAALGDIEERCDEEGADDIDAEQVDENDSCAFAVYFIYHLPHSIFELIVNSKTVDPLEWGKDPAIFDKMTAFRMEAIWPHIFSEERECGQFIQVIT